MNEISFVYRLKGIHLFDNTADNDTCEDHKSLNLAGRSFNVVIVQKCILVLEMHKKIKNATALRLQLVIHCFYCHHKSKRLYHIIYFLLDHDVSIVLVVLYFDIF